MVAGGYLTNSSRKPLDFLFGLSAGLVCIFLLLFGMWGNGVEEEEEEGKRGRQREEAM